MTHYLEEADQYADRIILISHGRIVADGTGSQIKALASGRTVRATLPGADTRRLLEMLASFAPEPIPLAVFESMTLANAIPNPRSALADLAAYSLATFTIDGQSVQIHRLVQEIIRKGPATLTAPLVKARKGYHKEVAAWAEREGYSEFVNLRRAFPAAAPSFD